jgi:single-strand DNA-binding protein
MSDLNKVMLIGNIGRDAELRYTQNGAAVASVSLATTEVWNDKNSGQKQSRTEWHRIVIWGKIAEGVAEYLTKGKKIYVEGRLQTREWNDKDGVKRYSTECRADRVMLLSQKGANGGGVPHPADEEQGTGPMPGGGFSAPDGPTGGVTDDDIPF